MTALFKRVVIHGVGLLGGSLGMALRGRGLAGEIVGLGRSAERLNAARELGAIDKGLTSAAAALNGADALFLCTPPRLIRESLNEIAHNAPPGLFVTDVGSVKAAMVAEAEKCFGAAVHFIGSHPMSGSEKSGVEAARADLFEHSSCFITPTELTHSRSLRTAARLWRGLGSRVVVIDPVRHDELLASISHLPHLVAVALVQKLFAHGDATLFLQSVLGNGFRDSTRVAAGPPEVWEQIFTENAGPLGRSLDEMIAVLQQWRNLLSQPGTQSEIMTLLAEASAHRSRLAHNAEREALSSPE